MTAETKPAIAFFGLGQMGLPMASRLVASGYPTSGFDPSVAARSAFEAVGGHPSPSARESVASAKIVITMLPDGGVVREVLIGEAGIAPYLGENTLIIDMSSSAPLETAKLGALLAAQNLRFIDAPVSGGVKRAMDGSLSIMAGGPPEHVETARPILLAMGGAVFATGPIGSGHAMKALNNFVSAAGLAAAAEALIIGQRFGLDPNVVTDVLNASTGRNNSTELKLKQHIISETYASGFSLALMAKDLGAAADLADALDLAIPSVQAVAAFWEDARAALPQDADHTEIHRYLTQIAAKHR